MDAIKNNKYFMSMRKKGTAHRKRLEKEGRAYAPLFSKGEREAFKWWAIAERYSATNVIVEELPQESDMGAFLSAYRKAGITSLVLTGEAEEQESAVGLLLRYGCSYTDGGKVYGIEEPLMSCSPLISAAGLRVNL